MGKDQSLKLQLIQVNLRTQPCPVCSTPMGDMPGSRDACCPNCGYKDPHYE